jgi:biotin carboxylase
MTAQPRLLVLGAGRHQAPLIRRAEARGIAVVASDYHADAPGKRHASFPADVDALDVEANVALARRHDVSGVVTTGTDMAVVTMAAVAAALDLPCYLTPQAALVATNKVLMAEAFGRHDVRRPPSYEVSDPRWSGADAPPRFPLVVKPADSQGQRGTTRVDAPDALGDAITDALRWSRSGRAVVDEFVPGYEVTVSAWVVDGDPHILAVTDRVTYNPPPSIGIAFQHVFPSLHAAGLLSAITRQVEGVTSAYGMKEGPLYIQMLVGDGDVFVVEAGGRVGGGHEASLIPRATGVDMTDRVIDLALFGTAEPVGFRYDDTEPQAHALVNFLLAGAGRVRSSSGFEQLLATEAIEEGDFYVSAGHVHEGVFNSLGRVGYFVSAASTRAELMTRSRAAYADLHLLDEHGDEMLFWPDSALLNG